MPDITLPQFAPGVGCSNGQYPNTACAACRSIGPDFDAWRLQHAGAKNFACPHGYAMGQTMPAGELLEQQLSAYKNLRKCQTCESAILRKKAVDYRIEIVKNRFLTATVKCRDPKCGCTATAKLTDGGCPRKLF